MGSYLKSGGKGSYFPPKCWREEAASWVPSACRLSAPKLASLLQECASLLQSREALCLRREVADAFPEPEVVLVAVLVLVLVPVLVNVLLAAPVPLHCSGEDE